MKNNHNTSHPLEATFHEYLDGELSLEDAKAFEAHLEVCEDCAGELVHWQSAFRRIESLPVTELTRNLAGEVAAKIQEGTDSRGVLYLMMAEAALGTTLGFVLWPLISPMLGQVWVTLGGVWQNGWLQLQQFLSRLGGWVDLSGWDLSGLEFESMLGGAFWLPTVVTALVLLFLGNGIVLKATQNNHQRS